MKHDGTLSERVIGFLLDLKLFGPWFFLVLEQRNLHKNRDINNKLNNQYFWGLISQKLISIID
jgi:hypothetical protein